MKEVWKIIKKGIAFAIAIGILVNFSEILTIFSKDSEQEKMELYNVIQQAQTQSYDDEDLNAYIDKLMKQGEELQGGFSDEENTSSENDTDNSKTDNVNNTDEMLRAYMVVRVVDGDTIIVNDGTEDVRVRLIGVNCAESDTKEGEEATAFTEKMLSGKTVYLQCDSDNMYDKYDRLLAWVFIDSELLQDKLIQGGYAEVAYLYGDYKYTNLLKDHQAIVETKKLGIWNNLEREEYNNQNNIQEDVKNVDDSYSDNEIKGTFDDAIDKIDKLSVDWKNITKEDIKNILFIVGASIIVAMWKPIKKKLKKKLK